MGTTTDTKNLLPITGSGGDLPRVLSVPSGQTLMTLSRGESIHALDISPNGDSLVVGTKCGKAVTFSLLNASNGCAITFTKAAPLLSVKYVDNQRIAATCITGKLLVARPPYKVPEIFGCPGDEAVGGLVRAQGLLFGVSESGHIVSWDLETFRVERHRGVTPPWPMAWAKGEYWAQAGAVAFPGVGGRLVIFDIDRKSTSSIPAHCGDFFAMSVIEGKLWTIGACDGKALVWRATPLGVEREISAPLDVVGVAQSANLDAPLVLLFKDGSLQPYADDGDALRPHGELLTGDYRSIVGISDEEFRTLRKIEANRRIEQLSGRISETLGGGDFAELGNLLKELRDLGRPDIALAAEAEHARLTGDVISELERRLELVGALPDSPSSIPALQRHSRLLENLGQFREAEKVLLRACAINDSSVALREQLATIRRVLDRLECSVGVLNPPAPLRPEDIVLAASVLGTAIGYPIVLSQSEAFEAPDCLLDPAEFVYVFNKEQNTIRKCIASCACMHACLLSWPYAEQHRDFVMLTSPSEYALGVGFGLQFQHNHHKTVVSAFLLLLPSPPGFAGDQGDQTNRILDRLEDIRNSGSAKAWVDTVSRNAAAALHKLSNITLNSQWKGRPAPNSDFCKTEGLYDQGSAGRENCGEASGARTGSCPVVRSTDSL